MHDHALLAMMALLLNALLAGPRHWFLAAGGGHITAAPAQALRYFERKLNRDWRRYDERKTRGTALAGVVLVAGLLLGYFIEWLFKAPELDFVEPIIMALLLPVRPGWDVPSHIRKYLEHGGLIEARQTLDFTRVKHHAVLDNAGVARAGIEWMAVHFAEKVLAPICWYLLMGLPGLFLSRTAALLHETLASSPQAGNGFSDSAAACLRVLHFLPAHLAVLMWSIVGLFIPKSGWHASAQGLWISLPASLEGKAVASAAYMLRLSLGGPSSVYSSGQWLGKGTPNVIARDIGRALYCYALLFVLLFVLLWLCA